MTGTALSPCYEENIVDVSQVYCELEIMSLGTEDKEGRENVIFHNAIFISNDTENIRPIPAVIIGECGSGKTTWSKNCVHQWCQYHANRESNLNMKDSTIPDIARFEILLYIQLKKKLEESSFLEHLRHTLFSNATDYYEYTMSCISKPRQPVLLLIDGLDEVTCNIEPIVNLLKKKENLNCSIVITSRPNGLEFLQEKVGISLQLFQIHGMNLENSKKYASKVLDILSRSRGEILYVDHFWKFANHIQVMSMCNIPLLCLSLILVWMEGKTISADLTDILLMIVEYYLRRAITREWYKAYIGKVLEQQHFDISMCITKTKQKQYIRDYGYLLKVISDVARNLWCLHMNVNTGKKIIENKNNTADDGTDVKLCLETGILMKTFINKLEKTRSQVIFSHPLLFDMFVAFSIAMEKGESFSRYITTKKAVVRNSNMVHMLFQVAPNIVQELIKDINKIFDHDNEKDRSEKTVGSDRRLNCDIECNNSIISWGSPAKWLKTLMCVDELSNAKLSLLTEGLKCTKDLTVFGLQLLENKNELIFRLPIMPKVQDLQLDIENCTLLLQEEQEWNKGNSSELAKLVIKSVNMDVKTTEYIVEAISTCSNLRSLELCPKDDLDAQRLALRGQKTLCGWGRLADCMKDMTKLSRVRLHNLHIGDHMPALLNSLCRCPSMELLDLMNLNEIGIGEILNISSSDRGLDGCTHYETKQSENSNRFIDIFRNKTCKTLQLIKNAMSVKSWLTVSKQIEWLSPHIIHIEQVHQPGLVFKDLLQGIGKCAALNILTICSIHAENVPVVFSDLQHLHKLEKLTLCKIAMPEIAWKELSETLARFSKLKELSLAHLEIKNCFIEVKKLSKLKFLEMRNVYLEEVLWLKLGGELVTLPYLEMFELVSCKMSMNGHFVFMEKMTNSAFHVKMEKKSKAEDSEMLSVDMVVTSEE